MKPLGPKGVTIGMACVHRVQPEYGKPIGTLADCEAAVAHPTTGASRSELTQTIAYLSAQVAGYQNSADRRSRLAMSQIQSVVDEYLKSGGDSR